MQYSLEKRGAKTIGRLSSIADPISSVQSALAIMATMQYEGAEAIILEQVHLHDDFFDLKTKLAGEILQKFTNYQMPLAIVGDFSNVESKSLRDFIYECNGRKQINFVGSIEEAEKVLL